MAIGQSGCPNVGFSQGDFTGWDAYTGYTPSYGNGICCTTFGVVSGRHTIISAPGTDPNTGDVLSVLPPGETVCARLGNSNVNGEAEKLEYSLTVNPNNTLFIYKYAVVLEDPGNNHAVNERPKFTIRILNSIGNVVDPICGFYEVVASGSIPGFQNYGNIRWKDWTTVGLDLAPYMGQNIKIEFSTYDCDWGGHFGYAYLKCYCSKMAISVGYCQGGGSGVSLSAPTGFSYLWSPGGQTTQNISISNPVDSSIYSCVLTSVNGCSITLQTMLLPTIINANYNVTPVNCSYSANFTDLTTVNIDSISSWLWTFGDGTTSALQNPLHTYSAPGGYNISLVTTSSAGACTSTKNSAINISPLSAINASSDTTICNGKIIAISATSGWASYLWSDNSDTASINVNPTTNTTYTVTATTSLGCTSTDNVVVNVIVVPADAGSDQIICFGQSANLTAYGGVYYNWSNNSSNQSTNVSPSNSTTYTVTVTDANNCTAKDSVQVTVKNLPIAEAGSNLAICFGDSTTLNASQGISYSWLPITNLSNPNIANPVASPIITTNYTVTVTGSNGCSAADSISIAVYPQISASAGQDQTICRFQESANLAAQGGANYVWSPATGLSNPNISNPIASPTNSTTYTVTVSDANSCTATDVMTITVNAVPTYTFISDSVNCHSGADGSIRLSPWGATRPYTYAWSPQISYDSAAVNISAGLYHVTITDNKRCDTTAEIQISEPPLLTISTSGNVLICNGESTTIGAAAIGGTGSHTFTWDNGLGTGSSFTVNPTSTTTYSVSVTDANNCAIASLSLTVTILPPLTVDVSVNPASICLGQNSVLTATANGGNGNYIYTWGQGIGISNQIITVAPATTTMYPVTLSDDCGSPNGVDSIEVIVNPSPIIDFVPDMRNGCQPLEVHFTDNSTPSTNAWLWNFGDYQSEINNSSTLQNPTHLYTSAGIYTVTLEATTTNNCARDSAFQNIIEVYPKPLANFNVQPLAGSTTSPTIIFFDLSTNATQWSWNFGDTASANNTSITPNSQHTYNSRGTYLVTLIVTSANGCLDTISKEVVIAQDFAIFFPSAFTPNDDGDNEGFRPEGEGIDLNNYALFIYDRWGELVFETNDFYEYWDGRIMRSSKLAEIAVYSWVVILKDLYGTSYRYKGHVTLVR
ncbi:MAG: PKD domain-containing protein [Bacteroidetes bacterium]|nr:PKD domain-containing protein [Bacteroidota bacterium]